MLTLNWILFSNEHLGAFFKNRPPPPFWNYKIPKTNFDISKGRHFEIAKVDHEHFDSHTAGTHIWRFEKTISLTDLPHFPKQRTIFVKRFATSPTLSNVMLWLLLRVLIVAERTRCGSLALLCLAERKGNETTQPIFSEKAPKILFCYEIRHVRDLATGESSYLVFDIYITS